MALIYSVVGIHGTSSEAAAVGMGGWKAVAGGGCGAVDKEVECGAMGVREEVGCYFEGGVETGGGEFAVGGVGVDGPGGWGVGEGGVFWVGGVAGVGFCQEEGLAGARVGGFDFGLGIGLLI